MHDKHDQRITVTHGDGTEMAVVDEILIDEIEQSEIDTRTGATTIHTGINLPDGGEGFIIIGRIVRSKDAHWDALKKIIRRVFIEYYPDEKAEEAGAEAAENTPPAQEDTVQPEQDLSGSAPDGEQAVSGEPRKDTGRGKRGKRV